MSWAIVIGFFIAVVLSEQVNLSVRGKKIDSYFLCLHIGIPLGLYFWLF